MFDWLGDILAGLGEAITLVFQETGLDFASAVWDGVVIWIYNAVYGAVAEVFMDMNAMGAAVFELSWVQAFIDLFALFGWALFTAGVAVAVFDVAIECQTGRVNMKSAAINVLKGFFACSLIGVLPLEAYKFSISLQNTFSRDLAAIFAETQPMTIGERAIQALAAVFDLSHGVEVPLQMVFFLIAFAYCTIKIFFANIKRGGILLIQIAVGSLYMFSVPRGFTDGFYQWCRQVAAICLTAFMQTTLLFLGIMTLEDNLLLGIGVMLAANEMPRIAQQFGLDSSVKVNVTSIVHSTTSAVNLAKVFRKGVGA